MNAQLNPKAIIMNKIIGSILFISLVAAQTQPEAEKPDIAINFVQADDELL